MIKAYVDIDSLFDLRLAVVHRLNPYAATELATNPHYFVRFNDDLWNVSKKVKRNDYKEAYANRNVDDLQNAALTEVLDELENICRVDAMQSMFKNAEEVNVLTINTYPIKLNEEQQQELAGHFVWHSSFGEVKMISLAPGFVLPELLKEQTHSVIYNLDEWVNIHFKDIQLGQLTGVSFLAPPMFQKEPELEKVISIIEGTKRAWQPFFFYNPMPIGKFCMSLPEDAQVRKKRRRK